MAKKQWRRLSPVSSFSHLPAAAACGKECGEPGHVWGPHNIRPNRIVDICYELKEVTLESSWGPGTNS